MQAMSDGKKQIKKECCYTGCLLCGLCVNQYADLECRQIIIYP